MFVFPSATSVDVGSGAFDSLKESKAIVEERALKTGEIGCVLASEPFLVAEESLLGDLRLKRCVYVLNEPGLDDRGSFDPQLLCNTLCRLRDKPVRNAHRLCDARRTFASHDIGVHLVLLRGREDGFVSGFEGFFSHASTSSRFGQYHDGSAVAPRRT